MSKITKDSKHFDAIFHSINRTLILTGFMVNAMVWYEKRGKIISSIIGSIICSAWASTLIVYICTENVFWLKIFFGFLAVCLICAFQLMWINPIIEHFSNKNKVPMPIDMKRITVPDTNDPNLKLFSDYKHIKYRVIDKNDASYNKQLFLYPIYGRLNGNGTMSFFKTTQITQASEEK